MEQSWKTCLFILTSHLESPWKESHDHSVWSLDIYVPFYAMWHAAYCLLTSSPWGRNGRYIHINTTFLILSLRQLLLNRPPSCFIVPTCIVHNAVLYSENAKYQRVVKDWRPNVKSNTCHIRFLDLKFWSGSFSLLLYYEACKKHIVAGLYANQADGRLQACPTNPFTFRWDKSQAIYGAELQHVCNYIRPRPAWSLWTLLLYCQTVRLKKKMLGFREEDHRPWEDETLGSGLQNIGAPTHRLKTDPGKGKRDGKLKSPRIDYM